MTPALYEACRHAVHVVLPDGQVLRAGRAALFVLDRIGYRAFARIMAIPPMIWGVELGYWLVARNRAFFSNFLFTRE